MADAYTEYLNLVKPEIGASRDAWGQKINESFDKIDAYAKAANTAQGKALDKTLTTEQVVAGSLVLNELVTTRKGLNVEGSMIVVQGFTGRTIASINGGLTSYGLLGDNTKGQVTFNQAGTRGVAFDGTQYQMPGANLFINTKRALVDGDIDLAPFFNRNTTGLQEIYGTPVVAKTNPEIQLVWGGIARWGWKIDDNKNMRFRNPDTDDTAMYLQQDGALWTKELGFINQRIEDRAKAYAEDRANAVGQQRVTAIALQGSWSKNTGAGQFAADHPGVMTGVGINGNGITVNITGRFLYFFLPSIGWTGASSI